MYEKQLRKYLRRQFSPLGWALVIYYLIMNVCVAVVMLLDAWLRNPPVELLQSNAWGYIAASVIGMGILLLWKGTDFWEERIWAKGRAMTIGAFLALLVLCIGCQMAASIYAVVLEMVLNQFGLSAISSVESATMSADTFSMFLYAGICAPITEEILCRGLLQRSLEPYGRKFAVFGSAFLFGMFHGNLFQSPYAFLVGLVLGYSAMEYSIAWAMLLHMINNLVLGDMLGRLTAGMSDEASTMLQLAITGGCAVAAIVVLVKNHRGIRAALGWEPMDKRCLSCFFWNPGVIVLMLLMGVSMVLMILP